MIKRLAVYIGEYKKYAILAPIMILIETVISLILPTLMSNIVDIGIAAGDTHYMLICGIEMIVLAIFGCLAGIACAKFSTKAAQGFGSKLRIALYHTIQDFSFADVDKFSTASLITRTTNDVRSLQMSVQMGLRVLMQAPCQLVVALVIVCIYSWKLALIYVVAIPLLLTFVLLMMRLTHRLFTIAQEKLDLMTGTLQENLVAIRVVKSFVRENYERQKYRQANDDLTRMNIRAVKTIIVMSPATTLILNIAMLCVYWFGGKLVGSGELMSGQLMAIITYFSQIMMSVMMFSMVIMQMTRAQACGTRVLEVLDTVSDIQDKPDAVPVTAEKPIRGAVEFQKVSFKYSLTGTGENVLHDISFQVKPGETVAVIGGTGSGKSSLVNLIPRFYDVTEGAVLVDGRDVRDYRMEDLRQSIGMVLQKNVLFSGTIRDNMRWGKEDATDDEIRAALRNAQALDFVESFPDGLDTMLAQGGTNVSGGQKQRLCIARAMLKKPTILILDDSTSAVDSDTESRIRESFDRDLKGCTVFIIAQRISSVVSADKIIVLDDGTIESVGTHAELMQCSPIYREIYTSQQEGVLSDE